MADPLDILTGTVRPRQDEWSNTLANIANVVASIPQRRRQAMMDARADEDQQMQREAHQQKVNDLKALDAAFSQPGGRESVLSRVPGHLRGTVAKQLADLDESNAKRLKAQEEARAAGDDTIARGLTVVRSHNYEPEFAQGTISTLKGYYQDDPQRLKELQLVEASIHENPTREHVKMITDALIKRSGMQVKTDTEAAKGTADVASTEALTRTRVQEAEGTKPIQPVEQARIDAAAQNAAATHALTETQRIEQAKHDRALEAASFGNLDVARAREAREAAQAKATGGSKLSATAVEKVAGIEQSLGVIQSLETLKKNEWLGPLAGRSAALKLQMPGVSVPDDLARFAAETATLKNSVVKSITGAQMSEPEAKRIMSQIPDLTDKPNVWQQKLNSTRDNLSLLRTRTLELSGATAAEPSNRVKLKRDKDGNIVRE